MEIHTREIYRRKKKFSRLTQQKAEEILGDVYSLISSSNLTLLTVVIDKQPFYSKYPHDDAQFVAWKYLLERINICIDLFNGQNGITEYGLIIMDETIRSKDEVIRNYMKYLKQHGTRYQRITNIIEDPVFSPSHWRNIIQLADATAYCCRNYEEKNSFFQKQFLTIQNKFHSDGFGKIQGYGYKKFPEKA